MTAIFDDPKVHDARIAASWAALQGARAAASRCPNAETVRLEQLAADRLDALLDSRPRTNEGRPLT